MNFFSREREFFFQYHPFFNFHGLRGVESEENAGNIKIQSFFIRDVSK